MQMFCLRDKKAEAWQLPFCQPTRAMALREIQANLEKDSNLARFAADFSVWEMGTFEPTKGIEGQEPHHLIEVSELLEQEER